MLFSCMHPTWSYNEAPTLRSEGEKKKGGGSTVLYFVWYKMELRETFKMLLFYPTATKRIPAVPAS